MPEPKVPLPEILDAEKHPEDVVAITILYNRKTTDHTVIWPQGDQNALELRGMMATAQEELAYISLTNKMAKVMKERMALSGGGKLIVPNLKGALPPNFRP